MSTNTKLAEALRRLIGASMVAMTDQELATGETLSAWEDANEALAAHDAEQAALRDLECPPDPEMVDRALAAADQLRAYALAARQQAPVPEGFVLVPVEFIEAGQRVAQEYARTNPKWPMWDNGEAEPKVQDPCGVHAWLEQAAMLAAATPAPQAQDSARTSPAHQPVHGWTDADADAARLALELECILLDPDTPMPLASRWWGSAHEALALHRQRLASEQSHGIGATTGEQR